MKEVLLEVVLGTVTAGVAALVLVPTFVVLKLLLDAGLEVLFPSVVVFGLLLAYILRRETVGH
ncbi:MAG TPA: hypothetical protein VJL31_15850 [Gemmatimonadales bacterium]|nr:hypothetical protein [Gemmatimonadales bacterium]